MAQAILTAQRSEIKITKRNANRVREEWIRAVEKLMFDAAQWCAEQPEWRVLSGTKEIDENKLGVYALPMLIIEIEHTEDRLTYEVTLEPFGRQSWRGEGQVLLSVYPTFHEVYLFRTEATEQWTIRTMSGIDWPFVWSHDVFFDLINRFLYTP